MTYFIPTLIALGFLLLCIFLGQGSRISSSSGGPAFKMALSSYGKTSVYFKDSNETDMIIIKQIYSDLVTKEKSTFYAVPNVPEAIINEGLKNLLYYRHHLVAAAEISLRKSNSIHAVAMYNNLARHSAPISINLIMNTVAKYTLGEEYSIGYINHPLDNINTKTTDQLSEEQIALLWLIILPLGFLFFVGSFIYFPYVELSTNFTQLQLMCGVRPSVYWLTTFVADMFVYMIFVLLMVVVSLAWEPFRGANEFGAMYLIFLLYGAAGIPFTYLFGRKKTFTGAYALFIILGIMLGVMLTVIVMVLEESGDKYYINVVSYLKPLLYIFCPQFGLTYSGVQYSRKVIDNYNFEHMPRLKLLSVCSVAHPSPCCSGPGAACDQYKSYISKLSPDIFLMIAGSVIFMLINILLHNYTIRKYFNEITKVLNSFKRRPLQWSNSEPPLGNFKLNIMKGGKDNFGKKDENEKTLRVKKLRKTYSGRDVVNAVDFDLVKGECLGILGVNGAGKTTTFRMLTRQEIKDDGSVQINNINIEQDGYLRKLGYCPQNDALNFSLTGRDILTTMAMLRGSSNPTDVVNNYLKVFELEELADIPCGLYSGGNKRKLSFAVAVIGLPPFILLDEPTTGVDPSSRRKLWSLIKKIKDRKNNSFILTSHSMTECEALCNDLKIMKEGTIKRHGTIAKLKQEINGYSTKFKLKVPTKAGEETGYDEVDGGSLTIEFGEKPIESIDDLICYLKEKYDGEVKDQHSGLLHFYIKNKDVKWSGLFKDFEELKLRSNGFIEDYTVSEASLEDVFLDVATSEENGEA